LPNTSLRWSGPSSLLTLPTRTVDMLARQRPSTTTIHKHMPREWLFFGCGVGGGGGTGVCCGWRLRLPCSRDDFASPHPVTSKTHTHQANSLQLHLRVLRGLVTHVLLPSARLHLGAARQVVQLPRGWQLLSFMELSRGCAVPACWKLRP
jgi:hypothetical protein